MVDILGHLGMALLWLSPSWYVFDRPKTAATVVASSFWFGMLPDVDLVLSNYISSIHHHGVFHTVVVVTILAVIIGPLLGKTLETLAGDTDWFAVHPPTTPTVVGIGGVWVAGLSHLFGDMLSAPDIAPPIEPLWPIYNSHIVLVDVVWYTAPWANWGLFITGLTVNVALWYRKTT